MNNFLAGALLVTVLVILPLVVGFLAVLVSI